VEPETNLFNVKRSDNPLLAADKRADDPQFGTAIHYLDKRAALALKRTA